MLDNNVIGARLNILVDFSVKFAEVGKTSSSHPHNKVLVSHVSPLNLIPILWYSVDKCAVRYVFELIIDVTLPCDSLFINWDKDIRCSLKLICVIENTFSNKTTRGSWEI